MKKALKIIGIIFFAFLVIGLLVYFFVLRYPKLKETPAEGKWYRVTSMALKAPIKYVGIIFLPTSQGIISLFQMLPGHDV